MMNNIVKIVIEKVIAFFTSKETKRKINAVKTNFGSILKDDDEIVQDVLFGYDEAEQVVIVLTNKTLYVIGERLLHSVEKSHIVSITESKGFFSNLVAIQCMNEDVYFKVYFKSFVNKIKDWSK